MNQNTKQKQITEGIKYWSQLLLLPIYGLSFLMPRSKKIWVFGSTFGRRFAENPKYLYLYTVQNQSKSTRAIWITHKPEIVELLQKEGYEAYLYHSLKGIWYCLRAKVYIFDNYAKDISFWLSGGAIKVNLWHGSGNKKTNHDNLFDKVRHPKNAREKFKTFPRRLSDEKPSHYTLATSDAMADIYTSAFQTTRKHIIVNGQPRNDMLVTNSEYTIEDIYTTQEKALRTQISQYHEDGYTVLAYMPTFRASETQFFDVMDLAVFNDFLEQHKYVLILKPHSKSSIRKEAETIRYSNIVSADSDIDIYTFLRYIDFLIADYSSVYTDFMLLERPVVAFHFDYTSYCADTRDSYIPFDEYMPEKKAYTMQELQALIPKVLEHDSCLEKRMISRKRMMEDVLGGYSKKMYNDISRICH